MFMGTADTKRSTQTRSVCSYSTKYALWAASNNKEFLLVPPAEKDGTWNGHSQVMSQNLDGEVAQPLF